MLACYNSSAVEIVRSEPRWSEVAEDSFWKTGASTGGMTRTGASTFHLVGNFTKEAAGVHFPSEELFPIGTVYFRVIAEKREPIQIEFCQAWIQAGDAVGCFQSWVLYSIEPEVDSRGYNYVYAQSRHHIDGEIQVLDGPPTHTEIPPEPTPARIYPTAPTRETAAIVFEHGGAVVRAGAEEAAIDIYVTSNFDFTGLTLSVPYPKDLLALKRVDEHIGRGAILLREDLGHLSYAKFNQRRRIGAEQERVKLVTLHFELSEAAREQSEIPLSLADFRVDPPGLRYTNWLAIAHQGPPGELVPVTTQVQPLVIQPGVLKIQSRPTGIGDVNLDYRLSLLDALGILTHLYLGGPKVLCPAAADVDGDGEIALNDAIGILRHVFIGDFAIEPREVQCY
jgi:hypothetical protein